MNTKNIIFKRILILPATALATMGGALAHCPLCTIGAGVVAVAAAKFGISIPVIALFTGAFAAAIGAWIARLIKWKIPHKETILVLLSYITTMVPLQPLIGEQFTSIPVYIMGNYGSILNKTYLINLYYTMSMIGAVIILLMPHISKKFTTLTKRENPLPYQGIILTFATLIVIGAIIQVLQ